MPKSKKVIPIYEYKEKVNGQTRYYIRPCIDGKQITKRIDDNGNMWLGNVGYNNALDTINKLQRREKFIIKEDITFGVIKKTYLDYVLKTSKLSTYNNYENVIQNLISPYFLDNTKLKKITSDKIIEWQNKLNNKKLSIRYKQKAHQILSSIIDMGKYHGIKTNVADLIGNFKEKNDSVKNDNEKIKYITNDEFKQFISVIDDILWKMFFIFLYYTGCRKGEVLALTWNDIDFKNSEIRITKTINTKIKGTYEITNTKNYENRTIKMNLYLKEQLINYKTKIMENESYKNDWFVFGNNKHLSLTTIDRKKDFYFQLSNVRRITTHEFRHSHVSLLVNEYLKTGQTDTTKFFVMMSQRMGHTIEVMQNTYMHLFPTVQDEIVNILNGLT